MDWLAVLRATWVVVTISVMSLLRLVMLPFALLMRLSLFLFSPVIYMVQYTLVPFLFVYRVVQALQPLYIFFGCAAFIGLLTGATLRFTSKLLGSLIGLPRRHRDRDIPDTGIAKGPGAPRIRPVHHHLRSSSSSSYSSSSSSEFGANGLAWTWIEEEQEKPAKQPSGKGRRRKTTPGLIAQTILEEEDDDA